MFPAMLDYVIRTVYPHLWERHRCADLPAGPADSKFDMCASTPVRKMLADQCRSLVCTWRSIFRSVGRGG